MKIKYIYCKVKWTFSSRFINELVKSRRFWAGEKLVSVLRFCPESHILHYHVHAVIMLDIWKYWKLVNHDRKQASKFAKMFNWTVLGPSVMAPLCPQRPFSHWERKTWFIGDAGNLFSFFNIKMTNGCEISVVPHNFGVAFLLFVTQNSLQSSLCLNPPIFPCCGLTLIGRECDRSTAVSLKPLMNPPVDNNKGYDTSF